MTRKLRIARTTPARMAVLLVSILAAGSVQVATFADPPTANEPAPEEAPPANVPLVDIRVDDVPAFVSAWKTTLSGRLLSHPACVSLAAGVTERIDAELRELAEELGGTIEPGWFARLLDRAVDTSSEASATGSRRLVLRLSPDRRLAWEVAAATGEMPALAVPPCLAEYDLIGAVDLAAIAEVPLGGGAEGTEAGARDDLRLVATALGLDLLGTLWFGARVRRGALELEFAFPDLDRPRGLLEAIAAAVHPKTNVGGALAFVPARTEAVSSFAIRPGAALRSLRQFVRRRLPEVSPWLDAREAEVKAAIGLDAVRRIEGLGDLSLCVFSVAAPAGGAEDTIAIARADETAPYWEVLRRIAAHLAIEPRRVVVDDSSHGTIEIETFDLRSIVARAREASAGQGGAPRVIGAAVELASNTVPLVARTEIGEGWCCYSTSTQALVRYRRSYLRERKLIYDGEALELVTATTRGAIVGSCARSGEAMLTAYNSVVAELGAPSRPGIRRPEWKRTLDALLLPAGESFAASTGWGAMRWEWVRGAGDGERSARGVRLSSRRLLNERWLAAFLRETDRRRSGAQLTAISRPPPAERVDR